MPSKHPTASQDHLPRLLLGRLSDLRSIEELYDGEELSTEAREFAEGVYGRSLDELSADGLRDLADEAIDGYRLGVRRFTTFRVELSTGTPAEWLEVVCTGDAPAYEVERIIYHVDEADVIDRAEFEFKLNGTHFGAVEAFVRRVVPELA